MKYSPIIAPNSFNLAFVKLDEFDIFLANMYQSRIFGHLILILAGDVTANLKINKF